MYEVIATGSGGNCVVLEGTIAVDLGVPFKSIKHIYRDLKLVLLTHVHGDHFNRATVNRLAKERPTLRWGCCEWMVEPLLECGVEKRNILVDDGKNAWASIQDGLYEAFCAFPLYHDVQNCGWKVTSNGSLYLYATDTSRIDVEAKNFDLYLVESNWEEHEVEERIEAQILDGKDYIHEYDSMKNHLSYADAMDFIAKNAGPKSRYVLLHGGKTDDTECGA